MTTLATKFKAEAHRLMPHMESLQDLDVTINDESHIDEIMFRRSELLGGMAAVILAIIVKGQ
jgi:hypothetical protein